MADSENIQKQWKLITRRLSEVNGEDAIRDLLVYGKVPKCFWATAPTGKPHIAYFVPLLKLADFANAGLHVTVLFCDLYAFLVNYKHPLELVAQRTAYYKFMVRAILRILGIDDSKVHFVEGSSYELTKRFTLDNYKLSVLTDEQEVRETGDEYRYATKLSVLLCPGLPALAEEYLDADFQFGGEDQRGLFEFNERFLPQLGYRKRAHMMNPMVPGLTGPKMSSSVPDSKIEFLDDADAVHRKVYNASCEDGQVENNGLLALLKLVVFPIHELGVKTVKGHSETSQAGPGIFRVKVGGEKHWFEHYESYDQVESAFRRREISSQDLKQAISDAVNEILDPLRKAYDENEEWQKVDRLAYPEE